MYIIIPLAQVDISVLEVHAPSASLDAGLDAASVQVAISVLDDVGSTQFTQKISYKQFVLCSKLAPAVLRYFWLFIVFCHLLMLYRHHFYK